ncbi:MAG: hypothetical protein ACE3L7_07005 [Candidatus Pristimantibacillus sp.]
MDNNNHCQIKRRGKIISMDEFYFIIEVEGKGIAVPISKVADGLRQDDLVMWSGSRWTIDYNQGESR